MATAATPSSATVTVLPDLAILTIIQAPEFVRTSVRCAYPVALSLQARFRLRQSVHGGSDDGMQEIVKVLLRRLGSQMPKGCICRSRRWPLAAAAMRTFSRATVPCRANEASRP